MGNKHDKELQILRALAESFMMAHLVEDPDRKQVLYSQALQMWVRWVVEFPEQQKNFTK